MKMRSRTGAVVGGLSLLASILAALSGIIGSHHRTAHPHSTTDRWTADPLIQGHVSNLMRWEQVYVDGETLYRAGKYDDAYKCWAECLLLAEKEEAASAYTGARQIDVLQQLAIMYKAQQKPALAADCYQRSIVLASGFYGKNDSRVAKLCLELGRMYTFYDEVKSFPKANEILQEAIRINGNIYGKYSIPTGDVAIALAQLKDKESQYEKAADFYALAIEIGNKLEPNDVSCCRIGPRQGLATAYEKMGRYADALNIHQELISMCRSGAENMMPTVVGACSSCLQKMGRGGEAQSLLLEFNHGGH